jgi:hypothetical protein
LGFPLSAKPADGTAINQLNFDFDSSDFKSISTNHQLRSKSIQSQHFRFPLPLQYLPIGFANSKSLHLFIIPIQFISQLHLILLVVSIIDYLKYYYFIESTHYSSYHP